jgi:hypothetical protein
VLVVAGLAVLALLCAAASWLAADNIAPAKISASVVLEGRTHSNAALTPEQAQAWHTWNNDVLLDAGFHQTLAKRMAERRLDQYADAGKLARRLRDDLTIDSQRDGLMILTLAGIDEDEVTSVLDVVATTLVADSTRQAARRADNVRTVATGERRDHGRIRYATLNSVPIHDARLRHAMPIFGGLFVVALVLILMFYSRLIKAKRVFDEENGSLFADARISAVS